MWQLRQLVQATPGYHAKTLPHAGVWSNRNWGHHLKELEAHLSELAAEREFLRRRQHTTGLHRSQAERDMLSTPGFVCSISDPF